MACSGEPEVMMPEPGCVSGWQRTVVGGGGRSPGAKRSDVRKEMDE